MTSTVIACCNARGWEQGAAAMSASARRRALRCACNETPGSARASPSGQTSAPTASPFFARWKQPKLLRLRGKRDRDGRPCGQNVAAACEGCCPGRFCLLPMQPPGPYVVVQPAPFNPVLSKGSEGERFSGLSRIDRELRCSQAQAAHALFAAAPSWRCGQCFFSPTKVRKFRVFVEWTPLTGPGGMQLNQRGEGESGCLGTT